MKKLFLLTIAFFCLSLSAQTINLQIVASGFDSPVEMAHPPGDSRFFVVQQGGSISILNADGTINPTPFLTLSSSVVLSGGERGLLGLAFHPNYASNGHFYVNYTRAGDGATVIARYSASANPNIANASSATVLLIIAQPYANHNGGSIKFGPDGYLYIGMGDGGSGGDPGNRAQNKEQNLGKILRIDVNSASPYGIPPTNPYVGIEGNDEIWAIGVRNPWKFSFNRLNGDLWIADVGQGAVEEINKIEAPLPNNGPNLGWRCYEGNTVYTSSANCPAYSSTVAPIAQYTHASGRCSISGGYVYTGELYPNLKNKYFFADYCTGEIGTIDNSGTLSWVLDPAGSITTFGEDKNGELYVALGDAIYKIVDTSLKVKGVKKKEFRFYPNPAQAEINFDTEPDILIREIKIFELTGKLIHSVILPNENNPRINVSHLQKGLYILRIEDSKDEVFQTKLIIE